MLSNSDSKNEIYRLRNKIVHDQASSKEMRRYLNLILESSEYNRNVMEDYIHEIGYNSVEEYKEHLNAKSNQELKDGLILIGGALLFGYLLDKLTE